MANYQSTGWNHRVLVGIKMARQVWSLLPVSQSFAVGISLTYLWTTRIAYQEYMAYTVAKPIED